MTGEGSGQVAAGGPAALRGFRLQSLYVLSRLLSPGSDVLQPEGTEDLDVFRNGRLVETCQIKALGSDLALSDLQPEGSAGYFTRLVARLAADPGAAARIVSFGPLGAELAGALSGAGAARTSVVRKLGRTGISAANAELALNATTVESVDEPVLLASVRAATRALLTGHDPDAAVQLLLLWIHVASEQQRPITREQAAARLESVGRYLAERSTHAAEWFTTIEPLEDIELTDATRERLRAEFSQGIAARFEHVLAGAHVPRPEYTDALDRGLAKSRVLVIRGSSGAGKSTLALAYMARLPGTWRFRVRAIEDRRHAHSIAAALLGHARALDIPLYVHLDVGPADASWPTLAAALSAEPEIKIIITVREEDWRRASTNAEFEFEEVTLELSKAEAQAIYENLRTHPAAPPTFDDAWARFGGAPGPLLEFVHLCTQGIGLRERLHSQVARIRDEVRIGRAAPQELELLRVVCVAAAFEGVLDTLRLCAAIQLPDPARTIQLFESEYLLRSTGDGAELGGLHPLRSEILVAELTDDVLNPWVSAALVALPALVERRLESFLLFAMSRRPSPERSELLRSLQKLEPKRWLGVAGVVRALLWRGLADYADDNRGLFDEVESSSRGFWSIMIDWDVARAGSTKAADILESLAATVPTFRAAADRAAEFRARQSDPIAIGRLCGDWLETRAHWPGLPEGGEDWAALGVVLFWATRLGADLETSEAFDEAAWNAAVATGQIEDLADAALGITLWHRQPPWWADAFPAVVDRFRLQTTSPIVRDDGSTVAVEFIVDPEAHIDGSAVDPHAEAVKRIDLLRRLLPLRQQYDARGHGHRLFAEAHDSTVKSIPAENAPFTALTRMNGVFQGYTERWYRPTSWLDFWTAVLDQRDHALSAVQATARLVITHFRQRRPVDRGAQISQVADAFAAIGQTIPLPQQAVDEWGFSRESTAKGSAVQAPTGIAVTPYAPFWGAHRDYWAHLENFGRQAINALVLQCAVGRLGSGVDPDTVRQRAIELGVNEGDVRLSLHNLVIARDRLTAYQALSETIVTPALLPRMQAAAARERQAIETLLGVWRMLVERPNAVSQDPSRESVRVRDVAVRRVRDAVLVALQHAVPAARWQVADRLPAFEGEPALVIRGEWRSARESLASAETTAAGIAAGFSALDERQRDTATAAIPTVIVVDLVRGRAIGTEGMVMKSQALASESYTPKWFSLVPKPLGDSLFEECRIRRWDDPSVHLADNLLGCAITVWANLAHLDDLRDLLSEPRDEIGTAVVGRHLAKMERSLEAALLRQEEQGKLVADLLTSRTGDPSAGEALLAASAALGAHLSGTGDDTANIGDLLDESIGAATIARATWIDLAIDT